MKKRTTWKKRLEPFGDLVYQMSRKVHALDRRELLHLENACKKASATNIGWAEYEAARIVIGLVRDARWRQQQIATPGKRDE